MPRVEDPDAPTFARSDGDAAMHIKEFLDLGIDPERMLTVVRVLADGLSHAAEAMRSAALGAVLHPGVTELEIAKSSQTLARMATPLLGPMIEDMLLLQLRRAVENEAVSASERAQGCRCPAPTTSPPRSPTSSVSPASVRNFHPGPRKAGQPAGRAGSRGGGPPVRFIKTIGDAVMFVSPDTAALLEVMLRLVDAAEADELLPRLRAGVAYGSAVTRAGDWFGSPVNTASRVTSVARPGRCWSRNPPGTTPVVTNGFPGPPPVPDTCGVSATRSGSFGFAGLGNAAGLTAQCVLTAQCLRRTAIPPATRAATSKTIAHPGPTSHHTNPAAISTGETANSTIAGCWRTTSRAARARSGSSSFPAIDPLSRHRTRCRAGSAMLAPGDASAG